MLQSAAAGMANAMEANGEVSGSAGFMVSLLMIAGGIVSIVARKGGRGTTIATVVIFILAALLGFSNAGSFADLNIWAAWCLLCGVLAAISLRKQKKNTDTTEA